MSQEKGLSCQSGFFYDDSVSNCLPCESICGGNGLNEAECYSKCPDYLQLLTTVYLPAAPAIPSNSDKVAIWIVVATSSVLLAIITVTVVIIFLWRQMKFTYETQTAYSETQPMCHSSNLEDGTLLHIAEKAKQLDSSQIPHLFPSSTLELPLSNPIPPIEQLCETIPHIPKSRTQIFKSQGHADRNSTISLRSDTSLPPYTPKLSISSFHKTAESHTSCYSSSIYSMFQMFGWLNKTEWVIDYSEGAGGLRIGVEGIRKDTAEEAIRRKGNRLPDFRFIVTTPTKGQYIPCPKTSERGSNRKQFTEDVAASAVMLKPGSVIFSKAMEPEPEMKECLPGHAIYSGSLSGFCGVTETVGITVGHLFERENLELSVDNNLPVGRCIQKFKSVHHETLNKITADLALLKLCLPTENTVEYCGRSFRLRLYKGELSAKLPKGIKVMVCRRDKSFCEGVIADSMFTFKKCRLFNTLCIVHSESNPQKISNEGDSGALVLSLPTPSSCDYLYVFGMVIGYWVSNDGKSSHTVATRLWNVLETFANNENLDFSHKDCCGSVTDSGYSTGFK